MKYFKSPKSYWAFFWQILTLNYNLKSYSETYFKLFIFNRKNGVKCQEYDWPKSPSWQASCAASAWLDEAKLEDTWQHRLALLKEHMQFHNAYSIRKPEKWSIHTSSSKQPVQIRELLLNHVNLSHTSPSDFHLPFGSL